MSEGESSVPLVFENSTCYRAFSAYPSALFATTYVNMANALVLGIAFIRIVRSMYYSNQAAVALGRGDDISTVRRSSLCTSLGLSCLARWFPAVLGTKMLDFGLYTSQHVRIMYLTAFWTMCWGLYRIMSTKSSEGHKYEHPAVVAAIRGYSVFLELHVLVLLSSDVLSRSSAAAGESSGGAARARRWVTANIGNVFSIAMGCVVFAANAYIVYVSEQDRLITDWLTEGENDFLFYFSLGFTALYATMLVYHFYRCHAYMLQDTMPRPQSASWTSSGQALLESGSNSRKGSNDRMTPLLTVQSEDEDGTAVHLGLWAAHLKRPGLGYFAIFMLLSRGSGAVAHGLMRWHHSPCASGGLCVLCGHFLFYYGGFASIIFVSLVLDGEYWKRLMEEWCQGDDPSGRPPTSRLAHSSNSVPGDNLQLAPDESTGSSARYTSTGTDSMELPVRPADGHHTSWIIPKNELIQLSAQQRGSGRNKTDGGDGNASPQTMEGTFGTVEPYMWKQRLVVIKKMKQTLSRSRLRATGKNKPLGGLQIEFNAMKRLRQRNIVRLYGIFWDPPRGAGLVMEHCAMDLYEALILLDKYHYDRAARRSTAPLPRHLARFDSLRIGADVAQALAYLHSQDLIHRDLKSLNVLVSKEPKFDPQTGQLFTLAKVCDFGETTEDLMSIGVHGTPAWFAPELTAPQGGPQYSKACDVFAFGTILWELMTFSDPHVHVPLEQIRGRVPPKEFEKMKRQCIKINQQTSSNAPQELFFEARVGSRELASCLTRELKLRPPFTPLPGTSTPPAVTPLIDLVKWCWQQAPQNRPSFVEIVERLAGQQGLRIAAVGQYQPASMSTSAAHNPSDRDFEDDAAAEAAANARPAKDEAVGLAYTLGPKMRGKFPLRITQGPDWKRDFHRRTDQLVAFLAH